MILSEGDKMLTAFGAFHVPSTILVGGGARREVVAQLQRFAIQRVLLVTDAGMMQLGPAREIAAMLDDSGVSVTIFDGVQPDPKYAYVTEIFEHTRRIGHHYGLYDKTHFQTRVRSLDWGRRDPPLAHQYQSR